MVRVVKTLNGLVPHLCVEHKYGEGYVSYRGPPEEKGFPFLHQFPQPRVPVPRREVSITSGCKNQQELRLKEIERGLFEFQAVPLKEPAYGLI